MNCPIYALTPFTMLDYPGHTACIVWLSGCNLRCRYCHNPQIVRSGKGTMTVEEIYAFLEKRQGKLEAVVFSGGEPTLCPDLEPMMKKAKQLGYKVKLDTNGTRPETVERLVTSGLVDFIALDYKAPRDKFQQVAGAKARYFDAFHQTLEWLCKENGVQFEVRTTVHSDLMNEDDVNAIATDLEKQGYRGEYFVQNYRETETLGHLPPQSQPLVTSKFISSSIIIKTRNF